MNRRSLLLSAGATALMLTTSLSAVALPPTLSQYDLPIRTLGVIEQALDVVVDYTFTDVERARIFGLTPWTHGNGTSIGMLRDRVTHLIVELGDTDVWNRARRLAAIRDKLDTWFPGNVEKQREAVDTPISLFGWGTLREMLNTGSGVQIARAGILLGAPVLSHDIEELRNFG